MLFENLKGVRNYSEYSLMAGVTDFGELAQFNMYEGGYAALICVKMPIFLEKLAAKSTDHYGKMIDAYKRIIQREFKSLDGLADIESEDLQINDGINEMLVTGKVTMQGGTTFSMRYQEKSGSPITKVHELYLRGIRDPRGMQVKHYHGLLDPNSELYDSTIQAGYENECFTYLYINTDNTMRKIEKAYLLVGAQPTNAKTSIYNYEKGGVEYKDVDVEIRAFPVTSNVIDAKAQEYLDWLHSSGSIIVDSSNFNYTGIEHLDTAKDY